MCCGNGNGGGNFDYMGDGNSDGYSDGNGIGDESRCLEDGAEDSCVAFSPFASALCLGCFPFLAPWCLCNLPLHFFSSSSSSSP